MLCCCAAIFMEEHIKGRVLTQTIFSYFLPPTCPIVVHPSSGVPPSPPSLCGRPSSLDVRRKSFTLDDYL